MRKLPRSLLLLLMVAACSVWSGCATEVTPGSGGQVLPDGNHVPQVRHFECGPKSGVAPLETTCAWEVNELDAESVSCAIDVGADGNREKVYENCPATGFERLTLDTAGVIVIRIFVADARGATAYLDDTITVSAPPIPPNQEPTISSFTVNPPSGGAPLPVTFTFGAADPDSDPLTCALTENGQAVVAASPCGASETRMATITAVGMHRVTLEVTDGKGGRATQDVTFEVTSMPQVGDLRISKIEWGQSTITTNPRLVAEKDALLRVYVLSQRPGITGVTVTATGTRNGTELGVLNLTGPATAPTADNANDLNQQFRVTVPAAWITAGLRITVRVDPQNALGETDEGNNESVLTPTVGRGSVLAVTHVPIVQSGRTGTVRTIDTAMKQVWPVKAIDAQTRAAYTYGGTVSATGQGWSPLLEQLALLRQSDGSRRNYLGWLNLSGFGGVSGLGFLGIGAALARDGSMSGVGTAIHELGHNMGREHAPCGGAGGPDPGYPVAGGRLDVQGWDYVGQRLLQPASYTDVMGYCDPSWISNYNYTRVQQFLESRPQSPSQPGLVSSPYIQVSGRFAAGQVTLSPLSIIETPATPDWEGGPYTLTLYGERTVSVPFGTAQVADLDEQHFALLIPLVKDVYAVEVSRAGQVLARRLAGPARPPQQAVVKPVLGGVEVSWDAAAFRYASLSHLGSGTHTTLALQLEGGRAFVSTLGLEDGGAFEVSLSDGVQSQRLVVAR